MYTNTCKIDVRDEPNSIEEVIEFIEKWKIIRKDAYFQLFAGYDMNFFREYYYRFRDRLIPFYFYYEGVLVGYNIIERVDKNKYNLLLRKVNTNYTNLCLFVDYYAMEKIFRNINEPIFLNMEGDVGSKGLLNYKTQSFHVPIRVFEMYDIRIPKTIGTLL
jgi:hypothetical protein